MSKMIEALMLLIIGTGAVWGSLQVPDALPGETWAGIMPMGAALLLVLLSFWMGGRAIQSLGTDNGETGDHFARLHVLTLFLIALIYQQSLRWFGYILPTAIVAPVVFYLFGLRNWWALVLTLLLCPLVFHLIFFVGLGVFPPYGEVFDLLDVLRG